MDKATAVKVMLKTFEECVKSQNTSRINDMRRRLIDMYMRQARKFAYLNKTITELRSEAMDLRARLARFEEDW